MPERLHEVIIFAGPHGAGKDTIEGLFTATQPGSVRHVRYSSRAQAPGEVQGQAYNFISPSGFDDMVRVNAFIDYAHYPEGSSGIAHEDLLRDVRMSPYTSITTNFEEGLTLSKKLDELEIPKRCLFVGPCSREVMLNEPDRYLGALAYRMIERSRASDDIVLRLHKAEIYRKLFIASQHEVEYINNEQGRQMAALEQVKELLS